MREYSNKITLSRNARGIWSLEPIMGCYNGTKDNPRGCFNDCYAAAIARRYGYDFNKVVRRYFENSRHAIMIEKKINKINMPFVRLGTTGDPSEDWEHTLSIIDQIKDCKKELVIITKHWHNLSDRQLRQICQYNVCINTSVSALDNPEILKNGIYQHHRLKPFCKSVLRVVTCDFNTDTLEGKRLSDIQDAILSEDENYIDTVFRPQKNNPLIIDGIINTKVMKFLKKDMLVSKLNKMTFLGKCAKCPEMCGVDEARRNMKHKFETIELF